MGNFFETGFGQALVGAVAQPVLSGAGNLLGGAISQVGAAIGAPSGGRQFGNVVADVFSDFGANITPAVPAGVSLPAPVIIDRQPTPAGPITPSNVPAAQVQPRPVTESQAAGVQKVATGQGGSLTPSERRGLEQLANDLAIKRGQPIPNRGLIPGTGGAVQQANILSGAARLGGKLIGGAAGQAKIGAVISKGAGFVKRLLKNPVTGGIIGAGVFDLATGDLVSVDPTVREAPPRQMNVLNPQALMRAGQRLAGFQEVVKEMQALIACACKPARKPRCPPKKRCSTTTMRRNSRGQFVAA